MGLIYGRTKLSLAARGKTPIYLLAFLGLAGLGIPAVSAGGGSGTALPVPSRGQRQWLARFASLPLSFELNRGQTDRRVKFLARGQAYTLFLTADEAVLALRKPSAERNSKLETGNSKLDRRTPNPESRIPALLRLKLVGADPSAPVMGEGELPGQSNYFLGKDPRAWHTHIPTYAKVRYRSLYPGVDLVYYGHQGQLENDFELAPGVDPSRISLQVEGADGMKVDAAGDLVLEAGGGDVRLRQPLAYQPSGGGKRWVTARYVLHSGNRVGWEVKGYDRRRPLIIDPVLNYSTYLGGKGGDVAFGIAVDSSGDAYLAGSTNSTDFPTKNGKQTSSSGSGDAFVAKLNSSGSALVYSTYLGGSGADLAMAIAVSAGDAFVTGSTTSEDFPTAPAVSSTSTGPFQAVYGGNTDAFVTQLNSTGDGLVYSSYLGGSGADFGQGVAVDASGNAYVTGSTQSANFPTVNPLQAGSGGSSDVFVAKVNFPGTALLYSTFLGGTKPDIGMSIKVDSSGNAYITGYTFSSNFPTLNPLQGSNAGNVNAIVAEVDAAGSALVFSTYLGGSTDDRGLGIALDASGNIYVTGVSQSTDFPTTPNALQISNRGQSDAFVSKLNSTGSTLTYSTLLGGSGADQGNAIAVDSSGDAFVTGFTQSSDFPTANAVQGVMGISGGSTCGSTACFDAFVSKLNPSGTALVYSTYLGGNGADFGQGIALDSSGNAYVAGSTLSANFPVLSNFSDVAGAYQGALAGSAGNAFAAMINPSNAPGLALAPGKVDFGNQALSVRSPVQTITIINEGTAPLTITAIASSSTDFAETDNCIGTVAASGGTCTINITFTPSSLGSETEQITLTDNSASSPQDITVMGTGVTAATSVSVTPSSLTFGNQTVGKLSTPQTATITNTGTSVLSISQISVAGDFSQTNTCGATYNVLNVGQSCTVSIIFTPTASGTRTASLSISDNATGSPQTVALSGAGVAVFSLSATASRITVVIGSTTAYYTVSASGPSGFTGSITLACSSKVTCAFDSNPIFVGQSTTLTVEDLTTSMDNPLNFTVTGTSGSQSTTLSLTLLFSDYTLSATPTLNTVVTGSPATYKVLLTPMYSFSKQVYFYCSNLPTAAKCSFSPSTLTPNGSSVATTVLTVTTRIPPETSSAQRWIPPRGAPPPVAVCVACLGALASLLALKRRLGSRAVALFGSPWAWSRLIFLALVLALATLVGSCRGVYSLGGTPAGNYSITVNGKYTISSDTYAVRTVTVNLAVTESSSS